MIDVKALLLEIQIAVERAELTLSEEALQHLRQMEPAALKAAHAAVMDVLSVCNVYEDELCGREIDEGVVVAAGLVVVDGEVIRGRRKEDIRDLRRYEELLQAPHIDTSDLDDGQVNERIELLFNRAMRRQNCPSVSIDNGQVCIGAERPDSSRHGDH